VKSQLHSQLHIVDLVVWSHNYTISYIDDRWIKIQNSYLGFSISKIQKLWKKSKLLDLDLTADGDMTTQSKFHNWLVKVIIYLFLQFFFFFHLGTVMATCKEENKGKKIWLKGQRQLLYSCNGHPWDYSHHQQIWISRAMRTKPSVPLLLFLFYL
jgi:hypothetical protein